MRAFRLTDLNLATNQRYLACFALGGHIPSGDVITRDTGSLDAAPFMICARCEVPYAKRHVTYNGAIMSNGHVVTIA